MLVLKLALVAASILLATAVARRFGHALGGVIAGMPMIAGPISAVLLIDQGASPVRSIVLGTLACVPASVLHCVSIAWSSRRWHWPACIALALALFLGLGSVLMSLQLPAGVVCALALVAPSLGLLAAPRVAVTSGPVPVPHAEIVLRLIAALAVATAILLSAAAVPATVSGLLLAVPITGTVLPAFTLPRHGAPATAALMGGFVMGLHGFAAYFVALYLALGHFGRLASFALAMGAAAVVALLLPRWRRALARVASLPA